MFKSQGNLFSAAALGLLLAFPVYGKSPYPSKTEIEAIFDTLSDKPTEFWSYVSPTVNWTIEGTHPAAGVYTNRTILISTFARIDATGSKDDPLKVALLNVVGGGEEKWSVQELQVLGQCKSGS